MALASRQAPKTTRPTMLCFSILTILLATVNTPVLADQVYHSSPPTTLVVYEHQDNTPPDQSFVPVASPSGNLSSFTEFGTIGVLSNILRVGEARDSPVLGVLTGLAAVQKDTNYLAGSLTYVLKTESFSGSISAQAVLASPGDGEAAITGGTYDFRFVTGYINVSTVLQDPEYSVFKNVLYIKYNH